MYLKVSKKVAKLSDKNHSNITLAVNYYQFFIYCGPFNQKIFGYSYHTYADESSQKL